MSFSSAAPLLPLSNDLVFKVLFSRQRHLLFDLINAVRQGLPPVSVVDVLIRTSCPMTSLASRSCWMF